MAESSSLLVIYGTGTGVSIAGWASALDACVTGTAGTIIGTSSAGVHLVKQPIDESDAEFHNFFSSIADGEDFEDFYGDGSEGDHQSNFSGSQFVYVPAQSITTYDTTSSIAAGAWQIIGRDLFGEGTNFFGISGALPVSYLPTPTVCALGTVNFAAGVYAKNYVTGATTYTYGVERTEAPAEPLSIDVDLNPVRTTAVAGIDYTNIFPKTLTWLPSENATKTFDVVFLSNPANTGTTFWLGFDDLGGATEGARSYADTEIIYPGTLDFTITGSQVNEGAAQSVTINRSSGSDGQLTASMLLAGIATASVDYTFTNLTKVGTAATAAFGDGDSSYTFTINTIQNPALARSATIDFTITELEYPLSGTQNYPEADIGTGSTYAFIMNNYDTGSLEMSGPAYNIYTASMPITWSVDRYDGSDGPVTATINLIASGGYATGAFLTDYTGSSGTFPFNLTWGDADAGSRTFSILTLDASGDPSVAKSISPYISSASVNLEAGIVTSSAVWVTYPGYVYLANDTSNDTVVEGGSYQLQVLRPDAGAVGELTATLSYAGSATSGTDYTFPDSVPPTPNLQHRISFENTVADNIFTVQTTDDSGDEDNETIIISLNQTSGTIYRFLTTGKTWNDGFAFDTGSLFSATDLSNTVTILDNESGSVDFSGVSASITQNSSITISVARAGGGDFAATATINQYSGTALQGRDYTGLPVTVYWDDQEIGTKTFTITTISAWATASAATIGMNFPTLVNIETGTTIPTEELTITNTVINESADSNPPISPDGTINNFKNAFTSRKNKGAVPFAYGVKTPFNLPMASAYSGSAGGIKNG